MENLSTVKTGSLKQCQAVTKPNRGNELNNTTPQKITEEEYESLI